MKYTYFALSNRKIKSFRMYQKYPFTLILLFVFTSSFSQKPLGQWSDYLSYNNGLDVAELNGVIYCATPNALFQYDPSDNSVNRLNGINTISDIGISALKAIPSKNALLIAYSNGNLDLLMAGAVYNIPDIKSSSVVGDKRIKSITIHENFAYLSTGLGIIALDIDRKEIRDTYSITSENFPDIMGTAVLNDTLYAASSDGLYKGAITKDLTIFNNWHLDLNVPEPLVIINNIASFKNKLYLTYSDGSNPGLYVQNEDHSWSYLLSSAYINSLTANSNLLTVTLPFEFAAIDENNLNVVNFSSYGNMRAENAIAIGSMLYIADKNHGLVASDMGNSFEFIHPDGPGSNASFSLKIDNNNIWLASGNPLKDSGPWLNSWNNDGFSVFINGGWNVFDQRTVQEFDPREILDVNVIEVDPEDPAHAYIGSWYSGIVEVKDNEVVNYYDPSNSSLQVRPVWEDFCGVGGLAFDENGVLWVTNAYAPRPLSALLPNGDWYSFPMNSVTSDHKLLANMIINQSGDKWIIKPRTGLIVYSENGTVEDASDDKMVNLKNGEGQGGLNNEDVYSIAEDLDGEIWVGTDDGISVFYSPQDIFSDNPSDARQILIEQDGNYQLLLESQRVTAIAVDGANRKWIGTNGSGVFLLTPDGTEEILRFREDNSPLLSNFINDIQINQQTGEVFFATLNGLISYNGDAILGDTENNCHKVYPNPVRESYSGPIAITGLLRDAIVKITDVRGNIVSETVSNGSQAVWDGRNLTGERVETGVYFALATNIDGSSTCVSKILVIK